MGFQKGNKYGKGRPKGSKYDDVRSAFIQVLMEDGVDGLRLVKQKDLVAYAKICASLLPKEVDANLSGKLVVTWEGPDE